MARGGYFDEPGAVATLPASVRAVRVSLFAVAALSLLVSVAGLATYGVSAELVGALLWTVCPAALGLVAAFRIGEPSRLRFWLIVAVAGLLIWLSVSLLGEGDGRGFTTLALPLFLLGAVLRRSSRTYFFGRENGEVSSPDSPSLLSRLMRRGTGDEGAGALEYVALLAVGALVIGGLVAVGMPGKVGSAAGSGTCRMLGSDSSDCGRPTTVGAVGNNNAGGSDAGKDSRDSSGEKDDCHGFWGCTWRTTKHVAGGVGSSFVSQWDGIKSLVTTNPLTTGKNTTKYLWSTSGGAMWDVAAGCTTGDMSRCRSGAICTGQNLVGAGVGCIATQTVVDDGVKDDIAHQRYAHMAGRVGTNFALLVVPTKVPGLGKIGELSRFGKARKFEHVGGGAPKVGDISRAEKGAESALKKARRSRDKAKDKRLSAGRVKNIIKTYDHLSPAEKTEFIGQLTPVELTDIWLKSDEWTRSDLLLNASKQTLKDWRPQLGFPRETRWRNFHGELFDGDPKMADISQGALGNCWCLAGMGAVAVRDPQLIRKIITQNPNGTYTVRFGDGVNTTVDNDLPISGAGTADAGWPAIMEKAFAQRSGGYEALEGKSAATAMRVITGYPTRAYITKKPTFHAMSESLDRSATYTVAFADGVEKEIPNAAGRGIVGEHSYTVIGIDDAGGTITLANPWGTSSPKVTLTRKEFERSTVGLHEGSTRRAR